MFGRSVIVLCVLLHLNFLNIFAANILDFFWEPSFDSVVEQKENKEIDNQKSCSCDGPSCRCCVDFNITYIDLGGPGCVEMKYISQTEGININISYGNSELHSQHVKGPNPPPTCMTLLADFAEICARFSVLEPQDEGLRACLLLEPKLLGDTKTQFDIGCFLMGNDGMRIDLDSNSTLNDIINNVNSYGNSAQNGTDSVEFSEEELFAVVNSSAEKGLVFFGNLLGLAFGKSDVNNEEDDQQNSTTSPETEGTTIDAK